MDEPPFSTEASVRSNKVSYVVVSALIPFPPLHSDKLICLGCYFVFKEENICSTFQQSTSVLENVDDRCSELP